MERVNPAEPVDCILNIAISEKKTQGSIRMNIDARPYNKGAHRHPPGRDQDDGQEAREGAVQAIERPGPLLIFYYRQLVQL